MTAQFFFFSGQEAEVFYGNAIGGVCTERRKRARSACRQFGGIHLVAPASAGRGCLHADMHAADRTADHVVHMGARSPPQSRFGDVVSGGKVAATDAATGGIGPAGKSLRRPIPRQGSRGFYASRAMPSCTPYLAYPSFSSRSASSAPPLSLSSPFTITCTLSGLR